jgi:hypothetical protein
MKYYNITPVKFDTLNLETNQKKTPLRGQWVPPRASFKNPPTPPLMMIPRSFRRLLLPSTPTSPVRPPAVSPVAALSRSLKRTRSAMTFNKIQVANPVVEMDGKRDPCPVLFPPQQICCAPSFALRRVLSSDRSSRGFSRSVTGDLVDLPWIRYASLAASAWGLGWFTPRLIQLACLRLLLNFACRR